MLSPLPRDGSVPWLCPTPADCVGVRGRERLFSGLKFPLDAVQVPAFQVREALFFFHGSGGYPWGRHTNNKTVGHPSGCQVMNLHRGGVSRKEEQGAGSGGSRFPVRKGISPLCTAIDAAGGTVCENSWNTHPVTIF